jgi:predicted peptidase
MVTAPFGRYLAMKVIQIIAVVLSAWLVSGCSSMERTSMNPHSVLPPGQHPQAFEKTITKNLSCEYLLFLPEGYGVKKQRWPMILFLHGAGERGKSLEKVKKHGPPKIVESQSDFPFILVSPQCPAGDWWPDKIEVLKALLDDIVQRYDVDVDRVYLTGLSMGGYGTWALAYAYPDYFAAIAPVCGGGHRHHHQMSERLKNLPIWAFHGAKDKVVPVEESEKMVNAVNSKGGNAKLTVYPDAYHDSWTVTYENQELYDWFLKHPRTGKSR